jgi:membrane-associated phospholipid phosphatase
MVKVLVFVLTFLLATSAHAQERDVSVKMLGNPLYDVGFVTLSVAGLYIGSKVMRPLRVDRAPLDGQGHRPRVDELGRAGDIAAVVGLTTGALFSLLGELGSEARGAEMFRGPVVVLEGALAGSAFTQLVKNAFGICRPRDWDNATRKCTTNGEGSNSDASIDEAHRAFPSGHSAPLAGMAGASFGMYFLPTTPRREHLAVALTSIGFSLTILVLRVRAGAHSWVDTGAAWITGGLAGFATAALHMTIANKSESAATTQQPVLFSVGSAF